MKGSGAGARVVTPRMKPLGFHPLCLAFPAMPDDEFKALVADVKREGAIREVGWLYAGKILEGRHRYKAARAAGLPMRFKEYRGRDPVAFVLSCNMRRRHLDEGQRAMVAARLAGFRRGGDRKTDKLAAILTAREAAGLVGASLRSVERAAIVRDKGAAELADAVDRRVVPVSIAAEVAASMPKHQQAAIVQLGDQAIMNAAKAIRAKRMATRHAERQKKLESTAEKNPELPKGRRFSFVLIDIPRKHNAWGEQSGSEKAPENHYPVMTFRETLDFAIDRFAAKDCVIAFWSTAASLIDDIEILADWGFVALRPRDKAGKIMRDGQGEPLAPIGGGKYGSLQIWRKVRAGKAMGMGRWFRDQHEQLFFCRRGDVPAPLAGKQDHSVFDAPIGKHSEKPNARTIAMINRLWPKLTKVYVFARGKAPPGWVYWGNEVEAADRTAARVGRAAPVERKAAA